MRVLAVRAVVEPGKKVKTRPAVAQREGVAVEGVEQQGQVAVGGKLVSDELAVLPDADDVGKQEDSNALVSLVLGRGSEIGVVLAGLDHLSGRSASVVSQVRAVRLGRGLIWD